MSNLTHFIARKTTAIFHIIGKMVLLRALTIIVFFVAVFEYL